MSARKTAGGRSTWPVLVRGQRLSLPGLSGADLHQPHGKRVDALRKNPELLAALVENPGATLDGRLILALKALRWPDAEDRTS
jgi:hypothetical protein